MMYSIGLFLVATSGAAEPPQQEPVPALALPPSAWQVPLYDPLRPVVVGDDGKLVIRKPKEVAWKVWGGIAGSLVAGAAGLAVVGGTGWQIKPRKG